VSKSAIGQNDTVDTLTFNGAAQQDNVTIWLDFVLQYAEVSVFLSHFRLKRRGIQLLVLESITQMQLYSSYPSTCIKNNHV